MFIIDLGATMTVRTILRLGCLLLIAGCVLEFPAREGYPCKDDQDCVSGYQCFNASRCVPKSEMVSCMATSCSAHGICTVEKNDEATHEDDAISCNCDEGYALPNCATCNPGYGLDRGACVFVAVVCLQDTCNGHGTCAVNDQGNDDPTDDATKCTCDLGYALPNCAACSQGYIAQGDDCALSVTPVLAAGPAHACYLKADGDLTCWGNNEAGQGMAPEGRFLQVTAGGLFGYSCAIKDDQTLLCWGDDGYDGSWIAPAGQFLQVAAGSDHTCALATDGKVLCWNTETWGTWPSLDDTFVQVAAGYKSTCGLLPNRDAVCWDESGLTGAAQVGPFKQIDVGENLACGLTPEGRIDCWGSFTATPPEDTYTHLSVGNFQACAVTTGGQIRCWKTTSGDLTPLAFPSGNYSHVSVLRNNSSFDEFACALTAAGEVTCVGDNTYAQATPPGRAIRQVSAGYSHICAVRDTAADFTTSGGALVCWGDDSYNLAEHPTEINFDRVSAGAWHSCARKIDGTLICWGYGPALATPPPASTTFADFSASELDSTGNGCTCGIAGGSVSCFGDTSMAVCSNPPAGTGFEKIAVGETHGCVLPASGFPTCWGSSSDDKLNAPAVSLVALDAGWEHTCGLTAANELYCWGSNDEGQSAVPAGTFAHADAGGMYTCAITTDVPPVLRCWGQVHGISGGTAPTTLPPGRLQQVSAGWRNTCVILEDEADSTKTGIWCFGDYNLYVPPRL
jgi:alpha-tubulin suppressor-like RCC1 family protein